MRHLNCNLILPDGSLAPIGTKVYAEVQSDDATLVPCVVTVPEPGRAVFAIEDCAKTGGANVTVMVRGGIWTGRQVLPPFGTGAAEGESIVLTRGFGSPFDPGRPDPIRQAPLLFFDHDDPGGNVSRSRPPEQVIPPNPTKTWPRGDFAGVTLVDRNGDPIILKDIPGQNTTPRNMYMSFLLERYDRHDQDLLLTGHAERSYSHVLASANVPLLEYVQSWGFYAGCWILGDQPSPLQSWAQAQPQIEPFLRALIAAGPEVCDKTILILGKELNSSCTPSGLLDICQHVAPICRAAGLQLGLHFSSRKASWQRNDQRPKDFWFEMSALGIKDLFYQTQADDPAGTMMAAMYDARRILADADPTLRVCFFEGCANAQLFGRRSELDGCRLGLEAIYATRVPGSNVPAVAGAWNGLRNLDGSPV